MVLEHLFPADWLQKKSRYGFILGFLYSIIGIALAKILFPEDPALVAVAFTSLMLLPELYKMFSIEEREEGKEEQFSIRELFKDNLPFVKSYLMIFLGILLSYSISSMILPSFEVNTLFREQLEVRGGNLTGGAVFSQGLFVSLLKNNFWVLVACFFLSLFTGDGAIFLITWNASVWGTIFGVTARNAASLSGSPLYYFVLIMMIVTPHMILEALSYILAAISGGVISKDVLLEKIDSERFNTVFVYNFVLFLAASLFLLAGVAVETFVLENSTRYAEIVSMSYD